MEAVSKEETTMVGQTVLDRFVEEAPFCVMDRAILENVFAPARLDELFTRTAQTQYQRELLFSTVVDLMSLVVCRASPSIHQAYRKRKDEIPVSIRALYDKLGHVEPATSRELVLHSAREAAALIRELGGAAEPLLAGYRVKILDGNHLAGTEHRLKPLRAKGGGARPGQSVVVLDPQLRIVLDVAPSLDAYDQECRLVLPLLENLEPRDVVIGDRLYSTSDIVFGIRRRKAFFIIRQHPSRPPWKLAGAPQSLGRVETGELIEQHVDVTDTATGKTARVRRVTIKLDQPTRDKDTELHLLTNLPVKAALAKKVAELYQRRWTIETAFQELTTHLKCELNTLGYPPAAVFGFCTAVACYNVLAVTQAALAGAHGREAVEGTLSHWQMAEELSATYRGMMIALPPTEWACYQELSSKELSQILLGWAKKVDVSRYRKSVRGPKKRTKRPSAKSQHVSTIRLLKAQNPDTG